MFETTFLQNLNLFYSKLLFYNIKIYFKKILFNKKIQTFQNLIGKILFCSGSACFAVRIEPGDLILLNKILVLKVEDVNRYASFSKMLQAESLEKVLPGVKTVEEASRKHTVFQVHYVQTSFKMTATFHI
uniref:ASCH domain-containing protein n=1 Tax=Salix viminalis TaxID=40686 RepID=A0A6N2MP99_SALVM